MNTRRWTIILALALVAAGAVSCHHPYGSRLYPGVPRFRPTDPDRVELLRREPRQDHIQLGEIWVRPDPGMRGREVEGILRERAARMGADAVVIVEDNFNGEPVGRRRRRGDDWTYEREIVGVAIRFRG